MLDRITPLILTLNEKANISRCLAQLTWAKRIVVVDSFSTDRTPNLVREQPNVDVFQRVFDNHAAQWNAGIDHVETEWVFSLDADYLVTDEFSRELAALNPPSDVAAYAAHFTYCVFGRPLRGSLYPPRLVLFRKADCRYVMDGHTQRLSLPATGRAGRLHAHILHDDRKPLGQWFTSQLRYASLDAQKLAGPEPGGLARAARIRRTGVLAPFLVLPYCLFVRRGVLDGWPGLYYALQRTLAELVLSLMLLDQRLRKPNQAPGAGGRR